MIESIIKNKDPLNLIYSDKDIFKKLKLKDKRIISNSEFDLLEKL